MEPTAFQQVDVVEALVREYLVRSGATKTLEAFNTEKPKHARSITKRELLRKALGLDKAAVFWKKQNPDSEAIPSTLEVWVNYQVAKVGGAPEPMATKVPVRSAVRSSTNYDDPAEASVPVGQSAGLGGVRRPSPAASGVPPTTPVAARPVAVRQGFGVGSDSPARSTGSPVAASSPAARSAAQRMAGMSLNGHDDDEPEIIRPAAPASRLTRGSPSATPVPSSTRSSASGLAPAPAATPTSRTSGSGSPLPSSSTVNRAAFSPAPAQRLSGTGSPAPPPPAAVGAPRPASRPASQPRAQAPAPAAVAAAPSRGGHGHHHHGHHGHHNDLVMEDVDDVFEDDDDGGLGVPGGMSSLRPGGPSIRKPGNPISPDTMRALRQLLWGSQGGPPPSWKQGFFFSTRPGLQFGLVQRQGGPCGVLAAVQAHVLAALHTSGTGFNTTPKQPEQLSALTAAIAEALWQARMGPTAQLVLPEGEAGAAAGRLGYDQLSRAVATHSASSKEQLMDLVRGALPALMSEDGWGVVLFVLSLALSRGVAAVQGDMDEPGNGLMGLHGYCTQELVNLILLGTAVSNVFDGNRELDGTTTLKGVGRRCRLGLLTLFEWYKYVEVGPSLKNPALPVWVVCSESHFTVLFAQDGRALQGALPFDLYYYDELANQEHIIKLSVSKDPKGGWTAKVGSTMGDRGKCEGHNIPPLECVIETRWPGVKVDWNGTEPIL